MPIRRIHFLILALVAMVLSQTYPRLYLSRKVAANSPAMLYPYDSVPQALDSNRVRAIIRDTATALRARLADTSAALRAALTDPAEVREIISDTADILRSYTRYRISDSLSANTRGWTTLPAARSAIHDTAGTLRTLISNAVVKNPTGPQTIVGATLNLERGSALSWSLSTGVTGDAYSRWFLQPDGFMGWGPGPADVDVTLMRSGPGVLMLNGALQSTNLAGTGPRPTYANAVGLVNDTDAAGMRGIIGATDTVRVRSIVSDTSIWIRARLSDTSSTLRALIAAREPAISSGSTAQYWRGDKTWQNLPTSLPPNGAAGGDLTGSYPNPALVAVGTAGTYRSVTTDAKGRVVSGTNPTTIAAYGLTDAQPLDTDLTAVAALSTAPYGRSLLTQADASTARATLGAQAALGYTPVNKAGDAGVGSLTLSNGNRVKASTSVAPSTVPNTDYQFGAFIATRIATSGTSEAAGIGFLNNGVNGAYLYLDPVSTGFRYSRDAGGPRALIWDSLNMPISPFAKTILDDADAATVRGTIGAQTSLGYTPVNKAGDVMTGTLGLGGYALTMESTSGSALGHVGSAGAFFTNTSVGDAAIRAKAGSVHLGVGSGSSASTMAIGSSAVVVSAPMAMNAGGTWYSKLINPFDGTQWSGSFGWGGNAGINAPAIRFDRRFADDPLKLVMYNPAETESTTVLTVHCTSCTGGAPSAGSASVQFSVPVQATGSFSGEHSFSSTTMIDLSSGGATLPALAVGTQVVVFNTSTSDRTLTATSGTLIINRDNVGNSYEEASIVLNRGGWYLVRVTSTRWVVIGAV